MAGGTTVVVRYNRLGAIAKRIETGGGAIIAKAAHDIEAGAKSAAPVDTGALRNSITASPESVLVWIVAVGVHYGIYQEFGTYKMPAHPFLLPAFNRVTATLVQALEALLK